MLLELLMILRFFVRLVCKAVFFISAGLIIVMDFACKDSAMRFTVEENIVFAGLLILSLAVMTGYDILIGAIAAKKNTNTILLK